MSKCDHKFQLTFFILLVGICVLPICFIAKDLQDQLVATKQLLKHTRYQLSEYEKGHGAIAIRAMNERIKTDKLRERAKSIKDELVNLQQAHKKTQWELLGSENELLSIKFNQTKKLRRLKKQLNVTMHELKNQVIASYEMQNLLSKNLEDRAQIETSLSYVQNMTLDMAKQLNNTKRKLGSIIKLQKNDYKKLVSQCDVMKERLTHCEDVNRNMDVKCNDSSKLESENAYLKQVLNTNKVDQQTLIDANNEINYLKQQLNHPLHPG